MRPSGWVLFVATLVWIALLYFQYFGGGRTLDFTYLSSLEFRETTLSKLWANGSAALGILLAALASLTALGCWGAWLIRRLGLEGIPPGLALPFRVVLGILLFNGLWSGLGLVGLWDRSFLVGILLLALVTGILISRREFPALLKSFREFQVPRGWALPPALLGAFVLLLSIGHAFVPDIYFDALVYHLSTLQYWLFEHKVGDFPTNLYAHYPFGAELYFFNGFILQGDGAAKLLNVLALGLCAMAVGGWALREAGRIPAWTVGALVLAYPVAVTTVWTSRNDVVLALFLALFLYALKEWAGTGRTAWGLLAGLLAGGALSVKHSAGIGVIAATLACCLFRPGVLSPARIRGWVLLGASALLVAGPWYLKNHLFTGNPLYPYLSGVMGGKALPEAKMTALMWDHQASFLGDIHLLDWLGRILTADLDRTIAPILFGFLPFLFLPGKGAPSRGLVGTAFFFSLLGGFLLSHQMRLQVPALVLGFLFMALHVGSLRPAIWAKAWTVAVVLYGILGLPSLFRLTVDYYHADRIWLGKRDRVGYMVDQAKTGSYFPMTRKVEEATPPGERILVVGDARCLHYPRRFLANSVFDEQVLEGLAQREPDAAGIRRGLRELGVDVLAVLGEEGARLAQRTGYYALGTAEWAKLGVFVQEWLDPVRLEGMNGLYRLREEPARGRGRIPDLIQLLRTPEPNKDRTAEDAGS